MRALLWLWVCAMATMVLGEPTVRLEQGVAAGSYLWSARGRRYAAFQGIPYARPPVGKLRFQEAVPAAPWSGVWPADEPGSECLQFSHTVGDDKHRLHGSEDCLFVNVYTPRLPGESAGAALDVVVFIHGGAFMFGSGGMFGTKYFMDRDVVFVTFNYRLGILGFLSTEDEVAPGNNGLKDQVLALEWVQRNIAAFGGDPGSVTLLGVSAGGASVHFHYLSPLSRGLFHRGISMSGTTLCPWTLAESLYSKAQLMAVALGCNASSSQHVVDCLISRPAWKVVGLTPMFQKFLYNPFSPFGPTVEIASPRAFLSKHPVDVLTDREVADLPWITSITTHEGLYPAAEFLRDDAHILELQERFEEIAPHLLDFNYTVPATQHQYISHKIRTSYLGDQPISRKNMDAVIQMVGDRMFVVDAVLAAHLQAAANQAPVFFYQFGYRGEDSLTGWLAGDSGNYGCSHGDDLGFILEVFYKNPEQTAADLQMTELLLDLFTSFAKTGGPQIPASYGTVWEQVDPTKPELSYLNILNASNMEFKLGTNIGRIDFWLSLDIDEHRTVQLHNKDEL